VKDEYKKRREKMLGGVGNERRKSTKNQGRNQGRYP
jgi:hypothetical protein